MDTFEFMQRNGTDFFCTDIEDDTYDNIEQRELADSCEESASKFFRESELLQR